MIEIPEEQILKEITDMMTNELPMVLMELEEQSESNIRLQPFRFVGLEEDLPAGTPLPYAFVEIEDGEYTEKDRIVKNVSYRVRIKVKLAEMKIVWRHFKGIFECLKGNTSNLWRFKVEGFNKEGEFRIEVFTKV